MAQKKKPATFRVRVLREGVIAFAERETYKIPRGNPTYERKFALYLKGPHGKTLAGHYRAKNRAEAASMARKISDKLPPGYHVVAQLTGYQQVHARSNPLPTKRTSMAKKKRSRKHRKNPIVTKTSHRKLHPENCPPRLASRLLNERKTAKRRHAKRPYRIGNCATPSAEYALRFGGGAEFRPSASARARGGAGRGAGGRDEGSLVDWWL